MHINIFYSTVVDEKERNKKKWENTGVVLVLILQEDVG